MKQQYKLLIRRLVGGVLTIIIVVGIGLLTHYHFHHPGTNSPSVSSSTQAADLSIGQQPESASAPLVSPVSTPADVTHAVAQQPLVPGCSLHFSFAPTADAVAPGGQINYSIVLTNLGEDTCENASFSVYYADNETFVSSSPKANSDNYYWVPGNLASRQTYQVTLSTQETIGSQESQVQNEACATANNGSDVCASNLIFVQPAAPAMPAAGSGATGIVNASAQAVAITPASAPSGSIWGAAFTSKQFATWIWDSPIVMTPSYEQAAIAAMKANGFNTVFLTIEDYIPIAAMPAGSSKTAQTNAYFAALNNFITQAQAQGISVYVEGGANDWGDVGNRWQGTALVSFIQQYDAAYPNAPIAGLQLDVESYLEPEYNTDPSEVIEGYLNLIADVTDAMKGMNAKLSIVIPHFYDDQIKWAPSVTFGSVTGYPYNQLLDILQTKPGSNMVILAYRNTLTGSNGTEAIAQTEMKEAEGYSTKIIVAQETGDVQPSYVTFYGLTKANLYAALVGITNYFNPYSSFGGVAVHYLDPFLELK